MAGENLAKSAREDESRPVLTINQMPQFVHQVTGDIRKMRPAIKVVGVDDQADPKLADLREGMVRYIENRSDAAGIYFQAADSQVACGIGHVRVATEYADDTTFEQEIRIEGVDDGVSVLWDPDAKRLTREDANWCFVPVDISAPRSRSRTGPKPRWTSSRMSRTGSIIPTGKPTTRFGWPNTGSRSPRF
jgi:hypothetical protein